MTMRATHASDLNNTSSHEAACKSVNRLQKYVRRGFALEPLSVLRSICYHEPAQPPLRICVFLDCPRTTTNHIEFAANTLTCYARQTTTIGRFAVARQKRTVHNRLRYQNMLQKHYTAPNWQFRYADPNDSGYVTAWMELQLGPEQSSFYRPDEDLVHIKGNQLAQEFSDNETLDKKKQNESNISWSPSIVRMIHNRTYGWLKACLMYNPQSPNCRKSIRAVPILAHFRDMSAALKRRGLEHLQLYAWVDNKSTLRHLRILLERGCESCTRNTPQDNMRECDHFNIDFSTCCL